MDILVGIAILSIALVSLLGFLSFASSSFGAYSQTTQATLLAQEMMEALRNHRDGILWDANEVGVEYDGLGALGTETAYHLEKSTDTPPKWKIVTGAESVGAFTRSLILGDVQRDANDNIVVSGGVLDDFTKKITATVDWQGKWGPRSIELVSYLTNWRQ